MIKLIWFDKSGTRVIVNLYGYFHHRVISNHDFKSVEQTDDKVFWWLISSKYSEIIRNVNMSIYVCMFIFP